MKKNAQKIIQFQDERLSLPLYTLKTMDNLISETVRFTQERKAFGRPVFDNQVIQFRLSELVTEVEALRSIVYVAVGLLQ